MHLSQIFTRRVLLGGLLACIVLTVLLVLLTQLTYMGLLTADAYAIAACYAMAAFIGGLSAKTGKGSLIQTLLAGCCPVVPAVLVCAACGSFPPQVHTLLLCLAGCVCGAVPAALCRSRGRRRRKRKHNTAGKKLSRKSFLA